MPLDHSAAALPKDDCDLPSGLIAYVPRVLRADYAAFRAEDRRLPVSYDAFVENYVRHADRRAGGLAAPMLIRPAAFHSFCHAFRLRPDWHGMMVYASALGAVGE